jgi:hypothetical protein
MLALAIVLLAVVVLLVVAAFVGSSEEIVIDFLNVTITTSVGGVFVGGVVAGLVALASLVALRRSLRGRWKRSKEVRELRRKAEAATPAPIAEADPSTGSTSELAGAPDGEPAVDAGDDGAGDSGAGDSGAGDSGARHGNAAASATPDSDANADPPRS